MQCPFKIHTLLALGWLIYIYFSPSQINWKSPTFLEANLPLSSLVLLNLGKVRSAAGLGPENMKCYTVIWNSLLSHRCCARPKFHHFLSPLGPFVVTPEMRLLPCPPLWEHLCGVICGWGTQPLDFFKQGLWLRLYTEYVCVSLRSIHAGNLMD